MNKIKPDISPRSFRILVLLLLAVRLFHFGAEIDAPHDWRQCDTAWYILDFFKNGIDLLHPAVCWMGATDHLALELPLPEALVALVFHATGESMWIARAVFMLFFTGAWWYFYKITQRLLDHNTARLAALVYLALPLSLFYSRAIHIDFFVLLMVHALVYFFLKGIGDKNWKYMALSGLAALIAFPVKAPYVLAFVLPCLYVVSSQKRWKWILPHLFWYLPAIAAFVFWQQHVQALNSASPDLGYIAHFRKMTQSAGWYFGTMQQRLSLYSWWILFQRGQFDVAGIGGILFFLLGCYKINALNSSRFLWWWIAGLMLYVLIFFNLNFVHNYYQIPLLGPVAILAAVGLHATANGHSGRLWLLFGLLVALNIGYTEYFWYNPAKDHIEIGRFIGEYSPENALVIVSYKTMDCRDPRILYRARRRGWSVEEAALNPEVLHRLYREQGAAFWAYTGSQKPKIESSEMALERVAPMQSSKDSIYWYRFRDK